MSGWTWLWIIIGVVVVVDVVLVAYMIKRRRSKKPDGATVRLVCGTWPGLLGRIDKDPSGAVMDADKLLAHALERLGYPGSMADKLKRAQPRFSDVQALWGAHKLRNRIAHEVSVTVTSDDARRALRAFERALRDLQLLPKS